MTLEITISELTEAVNSVNEAIRNWTAKMSEPRAVPAPAPAPAPEPAPAPIPAPIPAPAPDPVFIPAPVTPLLGAPFTDHKGLTEYCMRKYGELGPVKGGNIQAVLTEIGCKNLSEVTPDKYAAFFVKVEAL